MIRAAILGGTGYGGMELLRLLVGHPGVEVTALTSRTEEGPVADRHPHLAGYSSLRFTKETEDVRLRLARENDVVFFAKPHGVSAAELPPLLEAAADARIIDLSGDFRLPDPSQYPAWYGFEHPHPGLLGQAEYGLAECGHRDAIRGARLVANPGCHAAATILALWPLARLGLLRGRASVVSVTGSSGSGARAKAGTHHPERFTNFKAYRPLHHQHLPEVLHALGGEARVDFVPHSAPFARGIHVTAFVPVGDAGDDEVRAAFADVYDDEPFVRMHAKSPDLRACVGTNHVDVCVTPGDGTAVVTLAIDNLGKGMAGTAVQNLNLMFGLDETAGLDRPGAGL
ncbi:MAG: N-acetyl-gamma-glutamyl-phosphate reductase [Planctomycetota bacterium]|nr:N-acetyl-gamma-glutamyl-phosphate reductase [Planctomycetota bacterium]